MYPEGFLECSNHPCFGKQTSSSKRLCLGVTLWVWLSCSVSRFRFLLFDVEDDDDSDRRTLWLGGALAPPHFLKFTNKFSFKVKLVNKILYFGILSHLYLYN